MASTSANISYFLQLLYTRFQQIYNKFNDTMLIYNNESKETRDEVNELISRVDQLRVKMDQMLELLRESSDDVTIRVDVIEQNQKEFEASIQQQMQQFNTSTNQTITEFKETVNQNMETFEETTNQTISDFKEATNQTISDFNDEVNQNMETFKEETNNNIDDFKQETNTTIDSFKQEVNNDIQDINSSIQTINTTLDNKSNTNHDHAGTYLLKSEIINLIYPIGSIYTSMQNTDPGTMFENTTWERITDRFLWCANDGQGSNQTGGAYDVTLTENNLPSHTHTFTGTEQAGQLFGIYADPNYGTTGGYITRTHWGQHNARGTEASLGVANYHFTVTPSGTISNTGSGEKFSVIPPYISVFCWKRTA